MVVGEDDSSTKPAVNIANSSLNSLFHIKNDGKIGIGTTAPAEKLEVNGNVKADSFIALGNTYPDYVFEKYFNGQSKINPAYSFKSLEEIEAFMKEHHYIEGYKSIEDVERDENGNYAINMGEQSNMNMEKIEELYLHTIELNKKIEQLEALVEKLLEDQ